MHERGTGAREVEREDADYLLIRHGATAWSAAGRHTGLTDVPLSDDGEDQARSLSPLVSDAVRQKWHVLVSPLQRARRTAELAGFARAEICADAAEWRYGEAEGLTTAQIQELVPGWTIWKDGPPGGETIGEVAARARSVLDALRRRPVGVLVAHGHFLRVLASCWIGADPGWGEKFALDAGHISRLGMEHGVPVLRQWNLGPG